MANDKQLQRLRVVIRGAVQGVGFRPFIYRLATDLGLTGWVQNSTKGVFIEVEGGREQLERFLLRIERERPPRSFIQSLESSFLEAVGYETFEIRHSDDSGEKSVLILPDIATCADCLQDTFDPNNRRFRYPFTNCTNCGPRFSIIETLPYDRPHTTMKVFPMCRMCQAEYENPMDRRFHAQPNACPECGPHLELWDSAGKILASHDDALLQAAYAIQEGKIVAVKGLGGFHLMVDARHEEAVERLRQRKHREEKPLALMYPHLQWVKAHCEVSELEARLLTSPESPIVLLKRRSERAELAPSVAPRNPYLGIMLPYTPLHHLLMAELDFPVVATSGNLSDEPICIDERDALTRLGKIADLFLVHDRPIARHVDDSIVRIVMGRELVLRRARGYAPLPIHLGAAVPLTLAVGAHLKNSIAISLGQDVFISQHVGDLETAEAFGAFCRVIVDCERLYDLKPQSIACDAHPDYLSSKYARQRGLPLTRVQHHYAHVLSCMAENELTKEPVLGVSWDGTGYGLDGTVWGGEFLWATQTSFRRVGHLRTFPLPGGEQAIKEPRRTALGLLYEIFGDALFSLRELPPLEAFSLAERKLLQRMLQQKLNTPRTSSAGRLFDAVASIIGLRQETKFEGQAAMELEFALHGVKTDEVYDFQIARAQLGDEGEAILLDWEPLVHGVLADMQSHISVSKISAKFHNTLVEMMVVMAKRVGEERVVLTGGCFQNIYLTERAVERLRGEGFRVYWHQRVPPNDGGIALGQVVAAANSRE